MHCDCILYSGSKKKKIISWIHEIKLIFEGRVAWEVWFYVGFFFLFHWFVKYRNLHSVRHNFKLDKFCYCVIENNRIKILIFGNWCKSWGICDYQYTLHVNCLHSACLKRNYILCKHDNSRSNFIMDLREAVVLLYFHCWIWILA